MEFDLARLETLDADLGPLQVHQHRHLTANTLGDLTHLAHAGAVFIMTAVGHVDAHHIHPGQDHLLQGPRAIGGRTQGRNDFGSSTHTIQLTRYSVVGV